MNQRIKKVIFQVLVVIVLILGYYFLNKFINLAIPCVFHELTGLYCPGCGITRCLFAILHGDLKTAFKYNQLVFIILPFMLVYYIYTSYLYIVDKNNNNKFKKVFNIIWIFLLFIAISYAILRNLNYFDFLRP